MKKTIFITVIFVIILVVAFFIIFPATAKKLSCKLKGGENINWHGQITCEIPFSDGGKSCNDSKGCQSSICIAKSNGGGECSEFKSTPGCIKVLNNGVANQGICND